MQPIRALPFQQREDVLPVARQHTLGWSARKNGRDVDGPDRSMSLLGNRPLYLTVDGKCASAGRCYRHERNGCRTLRRRIRRAGWCSGKSTSDQEQGNECKGPEVMASPFTIVTHRVAPCKGKSDRMAPCTTTHTHPQGEPTDKCCEDEQSTESPFPAYRRYMQDDPQMRASDNDDERGDNYGCPIDLLRVRNTVAHTLGGSLCDNKNHLRGSSH